MIDHVTVPVRDYERSREFYAQALRPLGYVVLLDWHDERRAYLGLPGRPSSLWLIESEPAGGIHICLAAPSPEAAAALGGGLLDPDGNAIEVVYRPETALRAA
jgi:catechol 2,3-dioxygenase-like lactoylglutathione lyase family enzyme